MYLRITQRHNRDGSGVTYYGLAESVWNAEAKRREARVVHSFGRADQLDRAELERLVRSINRVLDDWQRVAPTGKARRIPMLVQKAQILDELKRKDDAKKVADEAIALDVNPAEIAGTSKKILRDLSGRSDVYPEAADIK